MDKKYIATTIALPRDVAEALEAVRADLARAIGFTPSRSETISALVKIYSDRKRHTSIPIVDAYADSKL